jgi:1-acyl-sn-glycerol-3-phosphate acyltransferase
MQHNGFNRYENCSSRHFSRWRFYFHLAVLRFICRPALILTYHPEVYGRENLIKSGSFIVVSNHVDTFDPIMVSHAVDYPIAFMTKKELFRNRGLAELIRLLGAFALDREQPSKASLRTALTALRSPGQWALCLFPEGSRSRNGELMPLKKGVGSLARKTQLPVLPVGIHRNKKGRFVIRVGQPIHEVFDADLVLQKVDEALRQLTARD